MATRANFALVSVPVVARHAPAVVKRIAACLRRHFGRALCLLSVRAVETRRAKLAVRARERVLVSSDIVIATCTSTLTGAHRACIRNAVVRAGSHLAAHKRAVRIHWARSTIGASCACETLRARALSRRRCAFPTVRICRAGRLLTIAWTVLVTRAVRAGKCITSPESCFTSTLAGPRVRGGSVRAMENAVTPCAV